MSDPFLEPRVADLVWRDGDLVEGPDLAEAEGREARLAACSGQFGHVQRCPGGEWVLARDPLGVNKLFWGLDGEGRLRCSNYWFRLLREGCAAPDVWSVPSAHYVVIDPERRRLDLRRWFQPAFDETRELEEASLEAHAERIRGRLHEVFREVGQAARGRPLYVSLSGGLDSTTIAVLAREHIGEFTAVTFAVGTPGGDSASDDLRVASRLAEELGVPFEPVLVSPEEIVEMVDTVLLYGQDWRDFNVHCGLVNAAVARRIGERHGEDAPRPLLLTGDVMNEMMADYSPVQYADRVHYKLPRLPMGRLRRLLVAGLDSGDREIGIFRRFGVDGIQPYAMCLQEYAALPAGLLERPRAKQDFVRRVMGERVPDYVYDRPKVRAQEGSEGRQDGTLAVLVDRGHDSERLARRFAELYGLDPGGLTDYIRAGFYRFAASFPGTTP